MARNGRAGFGERGEALGQRVNVAVAVEKLDTGDAQVSELVTRSYEVDELVGVLKLDIDEGERPELSAELSEDVPLLW